MADKYINSTGLQTIKDWVDTKVSGVSSLISGARTNLGTATENGYMRIKDGAHQGADAINIRYDFAESQNTINVEYETTGEWDKDRIFIIPTTDYVDNAISSASGNTDETFIGYDTPTADYSNLYYQTNLKGNQNQRMVVSLLDSLGEEELSVNIVDADKGINKSIVTLPKEKIATKTELGDLTALTTTDKSNLVSAINEVYEKSGEPFRVKNWASNTLNVTIPCCTKDIANTSIGKMDFTISGDEGTNYQVVGMIAYEVFDAASGGNRINCWPVCQFTGNGQKTLSVRWMCGGTSDKVAKRLNAWVLLKHR